MNNVNVSNYFSTLEGTLLVVEEELEKFNNHEGCVQVSTLVSAVSARLGWNEKQMRSKEPLVRDFIRNHPTWCLTQGAHGGIMKRSAKQKKEDAKAEKAKAKAEVAAAIDAKVAAQ